MATIASQAAQALSESKYVDAISLYTKALAELPKASDYYIQRSTAYQRSKQPELALKDAEIGLALAKQRQKRELIVSAQFRRAIALTSLGRWVDAKFVFDVVKRMDENYKGLSMWLARVDGALKGKEAEEATVTEDVEVDLGALEQSSTKVKATVKAEAPKPEKAAPIGPPKLSITSTTDKIREDWYQTGSSATLSLFVKGAPLASTEVLISKNRVNITIPLDSGEPYKYFLLPYGEIDPEKSSYRIAPTKIELVLAKAAAAHGKWPTIRASAEVATEAAVAKPPSYPTSSRKGPVNWDEVGPSKKEEDEEGDPLQSFFQKIYATADDDTKKAMMKSYQESNGTALSTNWADVKKGPVETSPPDGMVAKAWGKD
jgi:suppressor of G2 allele of SKP1